MNGEGSKNQQIILQICYQNQKKQKSREKSAALFVNTYRNLKKNGTKDCHHFVEVCHAQLQEVQTVLSI